MTDDERRCGMVDWCGSGVTVREVTRTSCRLIRSGRSALCNPGQFTAIRDT
jgi:hypothetical protein